jgi:uroporphyrinogen III methyltransferase/synthase
MVTFTSSSTVANLLALLDSRPSAINDNARTACIGPITSGTAEKAGLRVDIVARESTIRGLVEAMEEYYRADKADGRRST